MRWLTYRDALSGSLIYALGDTTGALLDGEFRWSRMLGMLLLGGSLYAIEIPAYFRWIDRRYAKSAQWDPWRRALLAWLFFNPLWIARHLAFIAILNGTWTALNWQLLEIATESFAHAAPVALAVNYGIQNLIPLRWRFIDSSVFSASMAVYFALSEVLFG